MVMAINDNSNSVEMSNQIVEIDFAREFKDSIEKSKIITFKDDKMRHFIEKAEGAKLLVVTSNINSPREIIDVVYYDEEFLKKVL